MISAFGAILLIAAGGYAGFSALEHLRTALRSAETILDASRDMRTEILCHRTPLPQLLERLGARYPRLFPDAENASMLVREFSFLSVWTASIRCAALPKVLEEPLLRFGPARARCAARKGSCRRSALSVAGPCRGLSSCRSASLVFTFRRLCGKLSAGDNRNMNRKILFFDVDGTIVTSDHVVPESARAALKKAQSAGHILIINTGRPFRHIEPQIRALGFDGYICSIGGHILLDGKDLLYRTIPHTEAAQIRDAGYACGMDMLFESEQGVWMDERCTSAIARREFAWLKSIGVPAFTDTAVPDFAFDKFVCWPQACADPERFERAFSDRLDFIRREHSMREVILKGLSKAGGMKTVMQYLGFAPKDSFAFGDGPNDLPMLREAGTSVLMGNAPQFLWKEADYVTAPITKDGLALALEHFGLI